MELDIGHAPQQKTAHLSKIVQFIACAFLEVTSTLVLSSSELKIMQICIYTEKQKVEKFNRT